MPYQCLFRTTWCSVRERLRCEEIIKHEQKPLVDITMAYLPMSSQYRINFKLTVKLLTLAKAHNEEVSEFPKGLYHFMSWLTKHDGALLREYVETMFRPREYYVDEAAQAEGRVQWTPQGLIQLATDFIFEPLDYACMGYRIEHQPCVPAQELPAHLPEQRLAGDHAGKLRTPVGPYLRSQAWKSRGIQRFP